MAPEDLLRVVHVLYTIYTSRPTATIDLHERAAEFTGHYYNYYYMHNARTNKTETRNFRRIMTASYLSFRTLLSVRR